MADIKVVNPLRDHPIIPDMKEAPVDITVTLDSNNQIVQITGVFRNDKK